MINASIGSKGGGAPAQTSITLWAIWILLRCLTIPHFDGFVKVGFSPLLFGPIYKAQKQGRARGLLGHWLMRSFREALGTYFLPWAGHSGRFGDAGRAVLRAEAVLLGGGAGRIERHLQQGGEVVVAGQAEQELLLGRGQDRDPTVPHLAAPEVLELHLEQLGLHEVPRRVWLGGVGNRDFSHGLRRPAFGLVRDQDDDARSRELTVDFVHRWVLLTRVESMLKNEPLFGPVSNTVVEVDTQKRTRDTITNFWLCQG